MSTSVLHNHIHTHVATWASTHEHIQTTPHIHTHTHTHTHETQTRAVQPHILEYQEPPVEQRYMLIFLEVRYCLIGNWLCPLLQPTSSRRLWKSKALREKEVSLCRSTYGRGPNASEGSRDVLTSLRHQNQTVFDVLAFQTLGECLYFVFSYQVHMNLL